MARGVSSLATLMRSGRGVGKYHVSAPKEREYRGIRYHSKAEARKAAELDLLVRAGKIASWDRQVPIALYVNRVRVTTLIVDFRVWEKDGTSYLLEVKGLALGEWKLKRRLYEALHAGGEPLRVVKA